MISGITGQDGGLLAALLLQKSYRVVGLLPVDRTSNCFRLDYLQINDKVRKIQVDLLDSTQLKNLMEEIKPDEFYNLASISSVSLSFKLPHETFGFNTRSVMNILEAIRLVSPETSFYQASSSEMFGNIGHESLPIRESFLFHPVSPYGISKASAHWLTVNYREAFKLKTCCGILFNHESALRPRNFVIKKIVRTALQIKKGEEIKLSLGNTSIIRDWGYAPYYVDAMWRMLQHDKMNDYLICSGTNTRLHDVVTKVFESLNLDAGKYVYTDTTLLRSLDLEIIYGDNSKAKRELGWKYDVTMDDLIHKLVQDEQALMTWEEVNV